LQKIADNTGEKCVRQPCRRIQLNCLHLRSERKWIKEVTEAFNRSAKKTGSRQRIVVTAIPMGSGECIDEILSGGRRRKLPAGSAAFVKIGNAKSRAKTGHDLLGPTDNLVLSPVVIAMWKPMAEAISAGKKPIGWADI